MDKNWVFHWSSCHHHLFCSYCNFWGGSFEKCTNAKRLILNQRRKNILQLIFVSTTVSLLALLYFFMDARIPGFFPSCPFHSLTGLFCPGCGSQRAISALLHADLIQAVHYNVLLVLTLPLVIYSAFVFVFNTFRKNKIVPLLFYSPFFTKVLLIVVVCFGVLRNLPYYPFTFLAPSH